MSLARPSRTTVILGSVCLGALSGVAAPEDRPPVDVGAGTALEVRLVTIDAVVLDRQDRTVAGLGPSDFKLTVDGRESAIETFDAECAAGSLDEPIARKRLADPLPASEGGQAPRRIVFVIDYAHLMPPRAGTPDSLELYDARPAIFENLRDAIKSGFSPGDEFMLAAIANGLRVEQPFTADRAQLLESARRMQYDVSLWNGDFSHTTEARNFQALEVLMEVLTQVPGPKAVVLFSDGFWPNGALRNYDPEIVRVSAMAGNARVTLYPVMARGLQPPALTPVG